LRAEILAATKSLLAETGNSDAVSVRAVAERVGVTTPSIYRHFKDKDDLLDAVCADVFGALAVVLEQAADKTNNPLETLYQQGRGFVQFALANPEQYRMTFMATSPVPHQVDGVLTDRCFSLLLQTVEACIDAGYFARGPEGAVVIGLRLFADVHGLAALLISKPWLPWGNIDAVVEGVIKSSISGNIVATRSAKLTRGGFARRMDGRLQALDVPGGRRSS
jgi:AcrR family transcriptional regulator